MRTVDDADTLGELVARLRRVRPDLTRRWGTLTPAEMLCHLGDAHESVLGIRVPPGPPPSGRSRRILKWLALYAPIRWPKGVPTRPGVNPKKEGTHPGDFEADRERAIRSLTTLAGRTSGGLNPHHVMFGPMTVRDWHRWAYLHVAHHLRQFGV